MAARRSRRHPTCGPTSGAALQITGTFPNVPSPGDLNTAVEALLNTLVHLQPSDPGRDHQPVGVGGQEPVSQHCAHRRWKLLPSDLLAGWRALLGIDLGVGPRLPVWRLRDRLTIPSLPASLTAADFLSFDAATDIRHRHRELRWRSDAVRTDQIFGAGAGEVIIAAYADLNIAINVPVPEPAGLGLLGPWLHRPPQA